MASIKSSNTKPEMLVRRAMHAFGLRFRLHDRKLVGKPDLVFPRFRAVVFVHGCFWHGHGCHLFKWPKTREEWWRAKIERNLANDVAAKAELTRNGWRVGEVWECALKGKARLDGQEAMQSLATWIRSGGNSIVIKGEDWPPPSQN